MHCLPAAVLAGVLAAAGCAAPAAAPARAPGDPAAAAAAFASLKALAGKWNGTFGEGEGKGPASVEYRVTAAGHAVEERLFPGTGHEMVTMYHLDGPDLVLTHYCAAGNQPSMVLVPGGEPGVLRFDFVGATNLASPGAMHMHAAVIDLATPGRILARWTSWKDGAPAGDAVLETRRAE
jgi:hypothetical protein